MSQIYHVILSGGVGSRLWPLSRQSMPKQYLPLLEGESLLKKTIDRNNNLADHLLIVCNEKHKLLCEKILNNEIKAQYIIESIPKNTAAAVAFAAFSTDPEDILIITPADHTISDRIQYKNKIKEGIELAKQNYLVTFGIIPIRPETGYGYIEHQGNDVKNFIEKPSYEKAEDYLEKGNFLWNSGIFCFKAKTLLNELKLCSPAIYKAAKETYEKSTMGVMPSTESEQIPDKSLDIAVMEKSDKIKVIPCDFDWSDLGSFEALYDYLKSKNHSVDAYGNMTINASNYTAFVGLENCICVHTDHATLILQKEKSQDVKTLYNELAQTNPELT